MFNFTSFLSPLGTLRPLAVISLFQEVQNILRIVKVGFYFIFFPLDGVRTTISKHAILEGGAGEIKTRRKITAQPNTHMPHDINTKPCTTTAPTIHPPKEGPIKDLDAQNWNRPMLPISSKNSGHQFNSGFPSTYTDKQESSPQSMHIHG